MIAIGGDAPHGTIMNHILICLIIILNVTPTEPAYSGEQAPQTGARPPWRMSKNYLAEATALTLS